MLRKVKIALLAGIATAAWLALHEVVQAEPFDYAKLFARHDDMVAPVVMLEGLGGRTGSAVVVYSESDPAGVCRTYVLSAEHVVKSAETVEVRQPLYDDHFDKIGTAYLSADVVYSDPTKDLTLLRMNSDRCFEIASIADVDDVYVGTDIYAVGFGFDYEPVLLLGALGPTRQIEASGETELVQRFSAPVVPGNSGGGLFQKSSHGGYELVGIVSAVYMLGNQMFGHIPIAGISWSVPPVMIHAFLDESGFDFILGEPEEVAAR